MSDKSPIEWTATVNADGSVTPGSTWNPVRGCTKVSPGCANCYAETFAERWRGVPGHAYEQGFDLRLVPEKLDEPLRWKKPRRVFVNSMSDLFQDGVPDEFIDRVFAVMALAPQHTFQVLTKRAERMREYLTGTVDGWGRAARIAEAAQKVCGFDGARYDVTKAAYRSPRRLVLPDGNVFWMGSCNPPDLPYRERWILKTWPLANVWLGVSVENQHFADERIPLLLQTPAAVRFISAEPLLGPLDLAEGGHGWLFVTDLHEGGRTHLDWVIVGGESGHGARPCDIEWARSIIKQCKAAGVACFVKQLGARAETDSMADLKRDLNGHLARGPRWLVLKGKGGDMAEWPEDLRVREFPTSRS